MKIHIVVNCVDYGDAVSNNIMQQQKIFRDMGYECDVYSIYYDERMKNKRKDFATLRCEPCDLLIHHYAGYFQETDIIKKQPCRKVFIYHNITPPEFVEGDVKLCQKGLEQIPTLKGLYDAIVGVSQFNVDCLKQLGMADIGDVLPIPVDFSGVRREKLICSVTRGARFLFVGRYAQNKKLEDIISSFAYYHDYIDSAAKLRLVGNPNISQTYTEELHRLIDSLRCRDSIELTGKVSDKKLQQFYADSDLCLCMSEHEGFCVPLIEAMWHQLPVFAFDAGAVRETMGNAGVVFTDKTPVVVAQMIAAVMKDERLLETIIKQQNGRLGDFSIGRVREHLIELLPKWLGQRTPLKEKITTKEPKKLKIQMQGQFESSYSLAQVNRFLIEAMHETGLADVSIHCFDGIRDYTPEEKNYSNKPLAKYLWQREKIFGIPDVAIRNTWPPVTNRLTAQLNFQFFGWEEDRVPQKIVNDFNRDLDGIGTTSEFVTQALKASGVTIPVKTIWNGVCLPANYENIKPYPLKTKKMVKFLHISSAFPRKGVDVLLQTYFDTFSGKDDVCLVLKTFPNIHNTSVEQLKNLRKKYPHGPAVEHIDMDLSEEELFGLYKAASCYVHCARGEGFGLPVAEAMLARIPVIVCNNTGLSDFCREDTCMTVGYTMVKARSHVSENSRWAEPDRVQLKQRMHDFVFCRSKLEIAEKVENAYHLISTVYTWEAAAKRWLDFIHEVMNLKKRPSVDMVTPWNNKCGIAEYARYFMEASNRLVDYRIFPDVGHTLVRQDEEFVQERVWRQAGGNENENTDELIWDLKISPAEIVLIQFNFNFWTLRQLAKICLDLQIKKQVVIIFHSTAYIQEKLTPQNSAYVIRGLNSAYRIVVHQQEDFNTLKAVGINPVIITIIPHGQLTFAPISVEQARRIIGIKSNHVVGTYGFCLPHKGLEKTIRAIGMLKETYPDIIIIMSNALYDADVSHSYHQKCKETIQQLHLDNNVFFFTDFLDTQESSVLLQACDVLIMPYDKSGESASGAVRFCVAAKRPLITTRQNIFSEFEDCSYQIDNNEPEQIAEAIECMFNPTTAQEYLKRMERHIEKTNWHTVVKQYLELFSV